MTRHLVALPGGGYTLPKGVVRPIRSHVTVHAQARAAGHPSVFDRETNPDRPVLPLDVQVALSTLDGLAQMVTRVAQKYGPNIPAAEWQRIRGQVGALNEARATVARWVDGDLTGAEGTVRP